MGIYYRSGSFFEETVHAEIQTLSAHATSFSVYHYAGLFVAKDEFRFLGSDIRSLVCLSYDEYRSRYASYKRKEQGGER